MGSSDSPSRDAVSKQEERCLSFAEKFTYSLGQTAVSLSPALISSWLVYYYIGRVENGKGLLLVSAMAMSLCGLVPRFLEAIAEPLVGYWSDKWNFKMGRRIPWVVFGTPFLTLFSILIWFPPDPPSVYTVGVETLADRPALSESSAESSQQQSPVRSTGENVGEEKVSGDAATAAAEAHTQDAAAAHPPQADRPETGAPGKVLFRLFSLEVTPNVIWLVCVHTLFWIMYTAVVAPYLSLLPEITPFNDERINVSMYMAYNDVAGSVLGSAGLGLLLSIFSAGWTVFGLHLDKFKVSGIVIGGVFTLCFYSSVLLVRETPYTESKAVKFNFLEAFRETFKNPTFVPYVVASGAIRMSTDIVLAGMPFMVTRIMNLEESYAGYLQGVIILGAAVFFPFVERSAVRRGKKAVYLFGMALFAAGLVMLSCMKHAPLFGWVAAGLWRLFGHTLEPQWVIFVHTMVCLGVCALPVAIIFVLQRPILNDVMDHDERLTGYRREAMYNGMEGLISKPASGIAYFIVPLLLKYLGDTPERPWGVLSTPAAAALLMVVGWVGFTFYQIEK
jgi:GPH family glycoside/pentoside/hexuronide:cation symporter